MTTGFYLLDNPNQAGPFFYTSRRACSHGVPADELPHLAVAHTAESLPDFTGPDTSGETLAKYASTTTRSVSWHSTVDADGTIPMLPDSYVGFHVVGYNSCSVGMEIATQAHRWVELAQSYQKWYEAIMGNAANQIAWWCKVHDLEPVRLTKEQADRGARGVIGHHALDPDRRTDPGVAFAWERFMADVKARIAIPPKYVLPRRFAHVFQMDATLHGSLIQQQALRDAYAAPFGSKQNALLSEFDRFYNRKYQRSYVTLEVKDFGPDDRLAVAGAVSIAFSDKLVPIGLKHWAVHEFGHVLDNTDYITQQDREQFLSLSGVVSGNWNEVRETWADAVRDWWNGTSWQSLDSILLRERI